MAAISTTLLKSGFCWSVPLKGPQCRRFHIFTKAFPPTFWFVWKMQDISFHWLMWQQKKHDFHNVQHRTGALRGTLAASCTQTKSPCVSVCLSLSPSYIMYGWEPQIVEAGGNAAHGTCIAFWPKTNKQKHTDLLKNCHLMSQKQSTSYCKFGHNFAVKYHVGFFLNLLTCTTFLFYSEFLLERERK